MAAEVSPPDGGMALQFAQMTHIGGRQSNQDALGSARQDDLACFVVSDGVGGQEGGEIAANIVIKTVIDSFLKDSSVGPRALQSYVDQAILQVESGKAAEERLANMSATVAAVLIDQKNRCALWAHMGDTRIYLFRNGKVYSVTKDHSLVQQFIDAGYCQPEQLRSHPLRGTLFAAVGSEGDTLPNVTQEPIGLRDGDAFLICTDGFWEWILEADMERALDSAKSVDEWLEKMNRSIEEHSSTSLKSRDNCTAFAIWVGASVSK